MVRARRLAGEVLQDWDAAAGTYRVILEAFPEHEDAFKALESIYQRRGHGCSSMSCGVEAWSGSRVVIALSAS